MTARYEIRRTEADTAAVAAILAELPGWFGRPESTQEYVDAAERFPNWFATTDAGEKVGIVLAEQHFPQTAEVHLMAVRPAHHRAGVGRMLLAAVEAELAASGTRFLTVKTLGASDPDENYRRTRLFYEATGFVPLEEFEDLWGDIPCLFMVKPLG